jgi:polyhydroxybutyrate depolymerase
MNGVDPKDLLLSRWGAVALWLVAAGACAQPTQSRPLHLHHADRERSYLLYRPENLSRREPVPLVLMLHGGFGSGSQAAQAYRWDKLADREGFVVVYPDGVGRRWNAGGMCCGPALREGVDDAGFLVQLIEVVAKAENIDRRRVYMTGMSNGAAMAHRYACEAGATVAAIGPVAGTFSQACPNPKPVSVLAIHGLGDQNVPFSGGPGTKGVTRGNWLPVERTLDTFCSAGRCEPAPTQKAGAVQTSTAHCEQGRDVVLMRIDGAGHQWPGSVPGNGPLARLLSVDTPSTALDATGALWDFFRSHPAPP